MTRPRAYQTTAAMPQLTAFSALLESRLKRPLKGPARKLAASRTNCTMSLDRFAPSSTSTIPRTRIRATAVAARITKRAIDALATAPLWYRFVRAIPISFPLRLRWGAVTRSCALGLGPAAHEVAQPVGAERHVDADGMAGGGEGGGVVGEDAEEQFAAGAGQVAQQLGAQSRVVRGERDVDAVGGQALRERDVGGVGRRAPRLGVGGTSDVGSLAEPDRDALGGEPVGIGD